ncbi:MAG: hypothetical protein L3J89_14330 [Gammaproteobacteria bacterium]|nr:hypothetical protein [Gammaproteobacteria bacterium]
MWEEGCREASPYPDYSDKWLDKFEANRERDKRIEKKLHENGWRVAIIWECATRKEAIFCDVVNQLADWLQSDAQFYESSYREK